MKTLWYPDLMRNDPYRKPYWRWDRANDIVRNRRCYSIKSDDRATGVTVGYLRALVRARSETRRARVLERYRFVLQAQQIFEEYGSARLEMECRLLARQNDTAIGYEMDLPCVSVQAYRDIFFAIDDRIDATSYIVRQVIGIREREVPTVPQLMLLCAYHHGPEVVEPWMAYLRDGSTQTDLSTAVGRTAAQIEIYVKMHQFRAGEGADRKMLKKLPFITKLGSNLPKSRSVKQFIQNSLSETVCNLDLQAAVLAPFSYAPTITPYKTPHSRNVQTKRRVA